MVVPENIDTKVFRKLATQTVQILLGLNIYRNLKILESR